MLRPLLNAPEPTEVELLKERIEELQDELERARREAQDAKREDSARDRSLTRLRQILEPLHLGLRAIFGELDAAGAENLSTPPGITASTLQPHSPAAWMAWKRQLSPACGRVIDALMVQPLSQKQLVTAAKMGYSTAGAAIGILKNNSLVEKDGNNRYRLKRL